MLTGALLEEELPDGWKLYRRRAGNGWLYFAWGPSGPVGLGWVPDAGRQLAEVYDPTATVTDPPSTAIGPSRGPAGAYGRGSLLGGETVDLADAVQALLSLAQPEDDFDKLQANAHVRALAALDKGKP